MSLRLLAVLLCFVRCSSLTSAHVRQAGKTCKLPDITASDGEIFVTALTGPCVKYHCNNGNILPKEYGCERDGECFPLGDTYGVGCFLRKCGPSNGAFHYDLVKEGCQFYSTCLSVNDTIYDECQKYQCLKEGDSWTATYSLEVIEWGCSYQNRCITTGQSVSSGCNTLQCVKTVNGSYISLAMQIVDRGCEREGKCYPVGDSFISGCIQRNCTLQNGRLGYVITSEACMYSSDKCVNVGEIFQDGCTSYLCSKTADSSVTTYSLDIHEEKCEDLNHQCLAPGTFFPYEISGVLKPNCTCQIFAGFGIRYSCF